MTDFPFGYNSRDVCTELDRKRLNGLRKEPDKARAHLMSTSYVEGLKHAVHFNLALNTVQIFHYSEKLFMRLMRAFLSIISAWGIKTSSKRFFGKHL